MGTPSANRLPIHHPDYRYPESRNPYWKKLQTLAGRVYSDNETETHRSEWRKRFPDHADYPGKRELHVELGCNAGHVTVEWAARNPAHAYVGLDWKFKPIFRAAEKGMKRGVGNLLFFRSHNERVPFMFAPGEVDFLYLFFPDPWAKKSQWKNRFVTAERLRQLRPVMRKGGVFHIKSDHAGYFEWMEEHAREVSDVWEITERTGDLHRGHPDPLSLQIPE
ncbi:MAG: tRNA (guanine(46)-N(7))-methyltransferase TrmB, partial [Bdellovibrionota bacterium]